MPVDVYVPGCPPRPEGLIYGMMKLQQLVKERRGHWHERADRARRAAGRLDRWTASSATRLEARFAERLTGPVRQRHDQTEIRIAPADVPEVHARAPRRARPSTSSCSPTSPASTPGTHMQVVYHLWSSTTPDWLRVIADGMPRDDPRVPSLTGLWPGAEWMEREAYDMFGIIFEGNRDLRRIYMPPDYTSFPLRKDFYLPDDAARSPGGGVRHMEQTHAPAAGDASASSAAP